MPSDSEVPPQPSSTPDPDAQSDSSGLFDDVPTSPITTIPAADSTEENSPGLWDRPGDRKATALSAAAVIVVFDGFRRSRCRDPHDREEAVIEVFRRAPFTSPPVPPGQRSRGSTLSGTVMVPGRLC
ncbi:hypothetical protein ACWEO4_44000 [Streptomyces sp. NPDC004393]